jgi:hypothetical protein
LILDHLSSGSSFCSCNYAIVVGSHPGSETESQISGSETEHHKILQNIDSRSSFLWELLILILVVTVQISCPSSSQLIRRNAKKISNTVEKSRHGIEWKLLHTQYVNVIPQPFTQVYNKKI